MMLRMIASTIGEVLFQATYKKADRQAACKAIGRQQQQSSAGSLNEALVDLHEDWLAPCR
jgi:hypothetical protein